MRKNFSKLCSLLFMAFGILSAIYGLSLKSWNVTFWKYMLLIGLCCCGIGILNLKFTKEIKSKILKRIFIVFHVLIILTLVSFIAVTGVLINYSHKHDTAVPDYVVILGAGLNGDKPSQILTYRLNESLNLISKLPDKVKIIVSGGQGPGETISEAEAMKAYLISNGIAEDRIIEENRSKSTLENLEFTKKLVEKYGGGKNITLVTSNFHMYRSKTLSKRVGFDDIYCWSAPVHPYITPVYYFRESIAVMKSLVFDWPGQSTAP